LGLAETLPVVVAIIATHLVFVGSWKHFGATSATGGHPLVNGFKPSSALGLRGWAGVPAAAVASATAAANARDRFAAIFNRDNPLVGPPTVADIKFGHQSSPSGELPNGYE